MSLQKKNKNKKKQKTKQKSNGDNHLELAMKHVWSLCAAAACESPVTELVTDPSFDAFCCQGYSQQKGSKNFKIAAAYVLKVDSTQ